MDEMLVLLVFSLATGLLNMVLAVPLIEGRVPRNGWYGFRVPKTLGSDDVWYPANRHLGWGMFRSARLQIAGTVFVWLLSSRLPMEIALALVFVLMTAPITIAIIRSAVYLRSL